MDLSKQSFIKGAMILLAAGIFNRILGFVPRIVLPRIIGAEGVGLYQMGWPLLAVMMTFITGGIPLAVSKLVAEAESLGNERRVRSILHIALGLSITIGLFFTMGSIAASRWITSHIFTDSRVYYTFITMSPIILLVSVSAVFRGYFQGRQNMIPTAVSQVAETIVRSIAVLIIAYSVMPMGVEYAAAGAMLGVLIGEVMGLITLLYQFVRSRRKQNISHRDAQGLNREYKKERNFMTMMRIAVPVTASRLVGSGSSFLESIMIVQSLALAGIAAHTATAQYGALQGMIMPLLLLPTALTYSLSISLIPSLSEAAARNDYRTIQKRMHQSLRLAVVTGAPFAVIMYVLAEPLCLILYRNAEIAGMLKIMAPAAIFIYLQAPLQAALQALDKPGTALLNTFIGASIKLILIFLLAAKAQLGILGAVIAITVHAVLVTVLHWNSVVRQLGFQSSLLDYIKVGTGAIISAGLCSFLYRNMNFSIPFVTFFLASMICVLCYLLLMVWFKMIDRHDIERLLWIGRRIKK